MSFDEASSEKWIIEKLQELGWTYNTPEELEDMEDNKFFLRETLLNSLRKMNQIPDSLISDAVSKLEELTPSKDGNSKFLNFLKNGINVIDENRQIHTVKLIDESKKYNNRFIVTNQLSIHGKSNKRPDILLFVNGMPIVIMENKNPYNAGSIDEAYNQIKGYEESINGLFTYLQIAVINNGINGELFPLFFNEKGKDTRAKWKTSYTMENQQGSEFETLLDGVFNTDNFVKLLLNYMHIRKKGDRNEKIIARYMQFRATEKILNRIYNNMDKTLKNPEKTGLIWHWQGSGKTLIMAYTAYQLRKSLPDATILIVVDRKDLDNQALSSFSDIQGLELTRDIKNTTELGDLIAYNNGNAQPGIFIVTIQKFSPENFKSTVKDYHMNNNVICLVDESHRTQYGLMAGTFRNAFPDAFVFGFTGTPIKKKSGGNVRNTFEEFCPPGEIYLDRYTMKDAQEDGFTVPIAYEYNAAIPAVKDHIINEALELDEETEGLTENEKVLLNRKIKVIKELYKTDANVDTIARDVANHFKNEVENTNSGLKAMLVAVDREACVMYKKKLDKLLAPETSEIVMTFGHNESSSLISEYRDELQKRTGKDAKQACKEFTESFNISENPKILIVTDMLLTGFDSPKLWVMYLAKPLFEERLLQAIGRTDRPFRDKDYGYIIDYVYLLGTLNKTLKKYEGISSKSSGIRGIVISREEIEKDFIKLLDETYTIFGDYDSSDNSHDNLNKLIKILSDPEISDRFEKNFRKLTAMLNLPRAKTYLTLHIDKYRQLAKAYGIYVNNLKLGTVNSEKVQEAYERVKKIISENFFLDVENRGNFTIDRDYLNQLGKTRDYGSALRALNTWHTELSNRRYGYPGLLDRIVDAYQKLLNAKAVNDEILQQIKSIKDTMDSIAESESTEGETKAAFREAIKISMGDVNDDLFNAFCDALAVRPGIKALLKGEKIVRKADRTKIQKSIRYGYIKVFGAGDLEKESALVGIIYKNLRDAFEF
ncbi:type I restriction endonuclease subunit R [Ferroplasma acidiphilum]|uniref:type I restriction endonuclease subunit R n=1 Tax=Ferroplasma acidiphilum TaxID=74969 RepID=UPI0028166EA1|nr:HsdR family type I site-specific deoxyribonuclease [Ferroplasma acidiphilum]WMT53233.1 MAG: HsdR family type I site-specific deoxyribonuclease [Ferroplasma acidiphilum]